MVIHESCGYDSHNSVGCEKLMAGGRLTNEDLIDCYTALA